MVPRWGINLIHRERSPFPLGEGKAGGSVVSKEASQAPPARCEATIANLTAAKQEAARQHRMRSCRFAPGRQQAIRSLRSLGNRQ